MRAIRSPVEPLLSGSAGRGLSHHSLSLSVLRIHQHNFNLHATSHYRRPCHPLHPKRWFSSDFSDSKLRRYQDGVNSLLAALRQNDTVKLYFCLVDLTRGVHSRLNREFSAAVVQIPVTTFSEIIHAFDPFTICREVDSASGLRISYGAALHTPLGELISKWGVKILYVRILNRLVLMYKARKRGPVAGNIPRLYLLPNDYKVLMRCAAAASDIALAKTFYRMLRPSAYLKWINSEIFNEFIKASYLTESLYARHDLTTVRLRPLDLHLDLPIDSIRRLRGIETTRIAEQPGNRAAQSVRKLFYAESLRKLLKLKKPLAGCMRASLIPGQLMHEDEDLVCTFIKAKGRHGDIDGINWILENFWKISIHHQKTLDGKLIHHISGGFTHIPQTSCIAPTEALLDAIVHGYGNSGEAQLAGDLIQYISNKYSIPIPDQVWSDLISYARIHRARPASREWLIAGLPHRVTHKDYIFQIWQTATQAPHNFKPRLEDYLELLREQVGRDALVLFTQRNLELIRQIKALYVGLTKELQAAWTDLTYTIRQGVPNHTAYRRFRNLQSRKHYAWYSFHYMAQRAFKHITPWRLDDPRPYKLIPDIIFELHEFLPSGVDYRTATGMVRIHFDDIDWREMDEQLWKPDIPALQYDAEKTVQDPNETLAEATVEELADEATNEMNESSSPIHIKIKRFNPPQLQNTLRPAFGSRPLRVAPEGMSQYSLKKEGKVFTGYPHEPDFAARTQRITIMRARGVPTDLHIEKQSTTSTLEQLFRIRR